MPLVALLKLTGRVLVSLRSKSPINRRSLARFLPDPAAKRAGGQMRFALISAIYRYRLTSVYIAKPLFRTSGRRASFAV
jgi:hypothetical protein